MTAHPYSGLTPDAVLDALESAGVRGDGRLLALNSYENRVYQVCLEEGPPVVAKFYRPARWTRRADSGGARVRAGARRARDPGGRAARARRKNPARVRRLPLRGLSAPRRPHAGARRSGHARMDRPLHRPHPRGRRGAAVRGAPCPRHRSLRRRAARLAARARLHPAGSPAGLAERGRPRARRRAPLLRPRRRRAPDPPARRLPSRQHPVDRRRPAFRRSRRRAHGPGDAGPVDAAVGRPRGDDEGSCPTCSPATRTSASSTGASSHLVEALRTLRLIHYSAWLARRWDDPAFPAAFPWFNTQRYWQDRILELREQVALMDEPPLGPV